MLIPEFRALGEKPTVYYCPYEVGDEEAHIYTISNAYYDGYGRICGNYKDGNFDELDMSYIFATKEEAVDSVFEDDIKITLDDDEVVRYSKDELEMMAYEEASGDYHDND